MTNLLGPTRMISRPARYKKESEREVWRCCQPRCPEVLAYVMADMKGPFLVVPPGFDMRKDGILAPTKRPHNRHHVSKEARDHAVVIGKMNVQAMARHEKARRDTMRLILRAPQETEPTCADYDSDADPDFLLPVTIRCPRCGSLSLLARAKPRQTASQFD